MADYTQVGNRWTAVYAIERQSNGPNTYRKLPFELVRFNVDSDPDAKEVIVPDGDQFESFDNYGAGATPSNKQAKDDQKVYERIWIVDGIPFAAKTSFGPAE